MMLQNSNGTRALDAGALGPRYVQLDELLDESREPMVGVDLYMLISLMFVPRKLPGYLLKILQLDVMQYGS